MDDVNYVRPAVAHVPTILIVEIRRTIDVRRIRYRCRHSLPRCESH